MGLGHSPSIVLNGLVFALDAGNTKSLLNTVEVLVVAGGGGGGMDMGGGGGGGGVIYNRNFAVTPGSALTVTVGNGGAGAPAAGTNGQPSGHQYTIPATQGGNSVFGSLTAIGGGAGGSSYRGYTPGIAGGNGGSGGGSSGYNDNAGTFSGGTGTSGQGFAGGNSTQAYYSGGGGGAGGPGVSSPNQPNGGPGVYYPLISPYYFGGGGGGASYSLSTGGDGGIGGGGGGAVGTTYGGAGLNNGSPGGGGGPNQWANTPGGNAGANTGGGGGGGSHYNSNNKGGDGGSGIVIIRYPGAQRATGGTVTSSGGYTIHTFTTVGSTTFTPLTWTDLSGRGSNGTLTNGPTYSSANGGSLVFDGTDDYVTVSNNISPGTGDFAVSVWVYKTETTVNRYVWDFGSNGGTLASGTSQGSGFRYYNPTIGVSSLYTSGPVHNINTWYNIVISRISGTTYFYSNGSLIVSAADAGNIGSWGTALTIGNYGGGGSYCHQGKISNFKIYNRALSAAEVSQNFNALRGRYGI